MYFPKSQIKTNLYANPGRFVYSTTTKPFSGYYFETSEGKYYTGKSPEDGPNLELISLLPSQTPTIESNVFVNTNNSYLKTQQGPSVYNSLLAIPPKYIPLQITEEDYTNGKITRYFCKKTNELSFIEIDKTTYQLLENQSPSIQYQLYIPFQFEWIISGNREFAITQNRTVLNNLKINGIVEYFKGKYDEYYKEVGS